MRIEREQAIFDCSARTIGVNCGIIGINEDLELSNGYDGGFEPYPNDYRERETTQLTKSEVNELADFMIALWTRFKKEKG